MAEARRAASPRRRTRGLRAAAGIVAAMAVIAVAGLPVYVFPPRDELPEQADAVYVIGPALAPRVRGARDVVEETGAPVLLVSISPTRLADVATDRQFSDCAVADSGMECVSPEPFTTVGEIAELADLAEERGWTSVVVVTRTAHIARTRAVVEFCVASEELDVVVVPSYERLHVGWWIHQYAYQSAAFVKFWITEPAC